MTIHGFVSGERAGVKVTVQFKACGLQPVQFRDAFETTTRSGGAFSLGDPGPFNLGVSGVFRAVSGDSTSAEIPVWQHPSVYLRSLGSGRFEAGVSAVVSFWRRHVLLQRYRSGRWVTLRRLVLTKQIGGSAGLSRVFVRTAPFRPAVPKGTRIRAVFPLAQAQPCYLAGVSEARRA